MGVWVWVWMIVDVSVDVIVRVAGKMPPLLGVTAHRGCVEETRLAAAGLHSYSLAHRLAQQTVPKSLLSPDPPFPLPSLDVSPPAVHNSPPHDNLPRPRSISDFSTLCCSVMARNQYVHHATAVAPPVSIALAPR